MVLTSSTSDMLTLLLRFIYQHFSYYDIAWLYVPNDLWSSLVIPSTRVVMQMTDIVYFCFFLDGTLAIFSFCLIIVIKLILHNCSSIWSRSVQLLVLHLQLAIQRNILGPTVLNWHLHLNIWASSLILDLSCRSQLTLMTFKT